VIRFGAGLFGSHCSTTIGPFSIGKKREKELLTKNNDHNNLRGFGGSSG